MAMCVSKIMYRQIILICIIGIVSISGCRKKHPSLEELHGDNWIALRIIGQEKGYAGFLVPLCADQNDPDWIFRHGIYCRDLWDIKRIKDNVVKDRSIITKCALSFISNNNKLFEEYKEPIDTMLERIKGKEGPSKSRLPSAKGDAVFLAKFIGQTSSTAGLVLPHTNMEYSLENMLAASVYIPDISKINEYFPVREITLMPFADPRMFNLFTNGLERVFEVYTNPEIIILKKTIEKYGGKKPM